MGCRAYRHQFYKLSFPQLVEVRMELEFEIVMFVVIFIAVTGAFYYFVIYAPEAPEQPGVPGESSGNASQGNGTLAGNETGNDTELAGNFYDVEELHWEHMPLTYRIEGNRTDCEGLPILQMEKAFKAIETATNKLVSFKEVEDNGTADVTVRCVDRKALLDGLNHTCKEVVLYYETIQFGGEEVLDDSDYLTKVSLIKKNDTDYVYRVCYIDKDKASGVDWALLGEAKPFVVGGVIKNATKTIYTANSAWPYCTNFPAREVHDILHLLGFGHSAVPVFDNYYGWYFKDIRYFKDIMFPYTYCPYKTEITASYADCLKYVYSNGQQGSCAAANFTG